MATDKRNISSDEIKKTEEYAKALDKLEDSLTGVNSALPKFANGLETGLKGIAEKLPEVVASMTKLNAQNKELTAAGGKPVGIFKQLASSMFSWNGLISVGVTLLATYGGAMVEWVAKVIKGEEKLTALNKSLKDGLIIQNAVSQTKLQAAQAAQRELADLEILYRASKKANQTQEEKKRAYQALRDQWPDTFGQLKDDEMQTGLVAKAYEDLKNQILAAAFAEAARDKIAQNVSRELENQQKIAKERVNNLKIIKDENKVLQDQHEYLSKPITDRGAGIFYYNTQLERIKQSRDASDKIIRDSTTDTNLLKAENEKYFKELERRSNSFRTKIALPPKEPANDDSTSKNNATSYNPIVTSPKSNNDTLLAEEERLASIARLAELNLEGYAKETTLANNHFEQLKNQFKGNNDTLEQLEKERLATLSNIQQKYQQDDSKKLETYQTELIKIRENAKKTAEQLAIQQLQENANQRNTVLEKTFRDSINRQHQLDILLADAAKSNDQQRINTLIRQIAHEEQIQTQANDVKKQLAIQLQQDIDKIKNDAAEKTIIEQEDKRKKSISDAIKEADATGHQSKSLQKQIELLTLQHDIEVEAARKRNEKTLTIDAEYAKKKAALEDQLTTSRIHAGDKFIDAALKTSKKDSAIFKAAFMAKKATSIADTIISTKRAVIESLKAYSGIPFIGQALGIAQAAFMAAQGASSIAEIAKQKPGFAGGGRFVSDGKGALLPGYSRTDDTNAYLRSGEAVVVSEAMRNPWARNLVSAINVAHGGRDFSIANPGRAYAIGGIFTDGGNSNRYYSQPVNDQKDLANTIAYQMINNFPPVYVDVKDINTQQSILAQTVNRVNL